MEKLIDIAVAAEMLGVTTATLRNWDRKGQLKSLRTQGGHRRYRLSDIEKLQYDEINRYTSSNSETMASN
jgi:excisionase family DNA binding protein